MISIIMPFKNEARHLELTLNSILAQSEKNFELIMVDDNSTDNSYKVALLAKKTDSRIKLFKNPGHGILDAIIYATNKVCGEFITRQDADDLMPVNKLATLKSLLLKKGPGHVSTGEVKYFSEYELKEGHKKYEKWVNSISENEAYYENIFKECVLVSSNWMMFLKDFKSIDGFNDLIYPEDYHFAFKLYENKYQIKSTKEVTHLWRDHPNRASRNLKQYQDQKFFSIKVQYFKKIYKNNTICLWGAGKTGKKLAKELLKQGLHFHWVTNNENKIGKDIYGVQIQEVDALIKINNPHIIISVTQRGAMQAIKDFLKNHSLSNYFEF